MNKDMELGKMATKEVLLALDDDSVDSTEFVIGILSELKGYLIEAHLPASLHEGILRKWRGVLS